MNDLRLLFESLLRHGSRRGHALAVLVALGVWSTGTAAADPAKGTPEEAPIVRADRSFTDALWLYADGDLRGALAQFRRAYAAFPDHRVWYNIAGVLRDLHDDAGSLRAYRKYLLDGGAQNIPPDRRAQVARTLAELVRKIGWIQIDVGGRKSEVTVDDQVFATSTADQVVEVNPGRHRVRVVIAQLPAQERVLDVGAGERLRVVFEIVAVPSSAAGPARSADRVPLSVTTQILEGTQ